MDSGVQEQNCLDENLFFPPLFSSTRQDEGKRKLAALIHLASAGLSLHSASIFFFSAHPLNLHLHYTQLELVWWRVMDGEVLMLFMELGSGGLAVSAVCKVAGAV